MVGHFLHTPPIRFILVNHQLSLNVIMLTFLWPLWFWFHKLNKYIKNEIIHLKRPDLWVSIGLPFKNYYNQPLNNTRLNCVGPWGMTIFSIQGWKFTHAEDQLKLYTNFWFMGISTPNPQVVQGSTILWRKVKMFECAYLTIQLW